MGTSGSIVLKSGVKDAAGHDTDERSAENVKYNVASNGADNTEASPGNSSASNYASGAPDAATVNTNCNTSSEDTKSPCSATNTGGISTSSGPHEEDAFAPSEKVDESGSYETIR